MSLEYLFFTYGKEIITSWIKALEIFRLCTIYPYPNDMKPERFILKIYFKNKEEMSDILLKLDFKIDTTKPKESRYKEYNENHSAGWVLIQNEFCYLDLNKILKSIIIEVSGTKKDLFKLDKSVFQRALLIEKFIKQFNFNLVDPPQDDKYCISPKYYPKLWD